MSTGRCVGECASMDRNALCAMILRSSMVCFSRERWQRAEKLAELPRVERRGWHAMRRLFANELKNAPLRDLAYLGGWKNPQTVLTVYQQPDEDTQRAILASRKRSAPPRFRGEMSRLGAEMTPRTDTQTSTREKRKPCRCS